METHTVWSRRASPPQVTAVVKMLTLLREAGTQTQRHAVHTVPVPCAPSFFRWPCRRRDISGGETGVCSLSQTSAVDRYCFGDQRHFFGQKLVFALSPSVHESDSVHLLPGDCGSRVDAVTVGRMPLPVSLAWGDTPPKCVHAPGLSGGCFFKARTRSKRNLSGQQGWLGMAGLDARGESHPAPWDSRRAP